MRIWGGMSGRMAFTRVSSTGLRLCEPGVATAGREDILVGVLMDPMKR